jgi:hypothetical protein
MVSAFIIIISLCCVNIFYVHFFFSSVEGKCKALNSAQ